MTVYGHQRPAGPARSRRSLLTGAVLAAVSASWAFAAMAAVAALGAHLLGLDRYAALGPLTAALLAMATGGTVVPSGDLSALGITAGFITLIANAAAPLMAIYLVAMRLPKMQFVGTAAVFFMVLNLFKVPFMVELGLITAQSFEFNLMLAPAVLLGAFMGRWLLIRINQRLFETLVLALSGIAGVLLMV